MQRRSRNKSPWVLLPILVGILLVVQPHTANAQLSVAEQQGEALSPQKKRKKLSQERVLPG